MDRHRGGARRALGRSLHTQDNRGPEGLRPAGGSAHHTRPRAFARRHRISTGRAWRWEASPLPARTSLRGDGADAAWLQWPGVPVRKPTQGTRWPSGTVLGAQGHLCCPDTGSLQCLSSGSARSGGHTDTARGVMPFLWVAQGWAGGPGVGPARASRAVCLVGGPVLSWDSSREQSELWRMVQGPLTMLQKPLGASRLLLSLSVT